MRTLAQWVDDELYHRRGGGNSPTCLRLVRSWKVVFAAGMPDEMNSRLDCGVYLLAALKSYALGRSLNKGPLQGELTALHGGTLAETSDEAVQFRYRIMQELLDCRVHILESSSRVLHAETKVPCEAHDIHVPCTWQPDPPRGGPSMMLPLMGSMQQSAGETVLPVSAPELIDMDVVQLHDSGNASHGTRFGCNVKPTADSKGGVGSTLWGKGLENRRNKQQISAALLSLVTPHQRSLVQAMEVDAALEDSHGCSVRPGEVASTVQPLEAMEVAAVQDNVNGRNVEPVGGAAVAVMYVDATVAQAIRSIDVVHGVKGPAMAEHQEETTDDQTIMTAILESHAAAKVIRGHLKKEASCLTAVKHKKKRLRNKAKRKRERLEAEEGVAPVMWPQNTTEAVVLPATSLTPQCIRCGAWGEAMGKDAGFVCLSCHKRVHVSCGPGVAHRICSSCRTRANVVDLCDRLHANRMYAFASEMFSGTSSFFQEMKNLVEEGLIGTFLPRQAFEINPWCKHYAEQLGKDGVIPLCTQNHWSSMSH